MESQEGPPQGKTGVIKRIGEGLRSFRSYLKEVTTFNYQMPLEEINDQSVAESIRTGIWLEGMRIGIDRSDQLFSVTTILNQIHQKGTPDMLGRDKYRRELPLKREAVQKILSNWVNEDIVEMEHRPQPDAAGDVIFYTVKDKAAFRRISQGDQIGLPVKPKVRRSPKNPPI
ncbi:MAG: hypothetical protein Q8P92_03280 [Candidatus Daviesbacteria bacterium]|nr:hypothetical protein [Candidatus Daviesbacteria bacterium]